ncbi:MAG: glycosyltransferase family 2 protein [Myxococcota bacterium]
MSMLGLGVAALAVLTWAVLLGVAISNLRRTPRPEPLPAVRTPLPVTVLMPARDEAEVIADAVMRVLREPIQRLLVVDDRSTDGTDQVLAQIHDPRLRIIEGQGPAPGELGKPAALCRAMEVEPPETPWLLFLDADVLLEEGAVASLLEIAEKSGADLLTVLPALELSSPIEELMMPTIAALIAMRYSAARVADPAQPIAFANGQLILIKASTYAATGGHRAVISEVLEDVRLAERVKAAGGRLWLGDGRRLARTRMYNGLREIIEGWSKNLYLLLGATPGRAFLAAAGSVLGASLGLIALLVGGWPYGAIAYAFSLGAQMLIRRRGGAAPLYALLAPISSLFTAALIAESYRRFRSKRVQWKGRTYGGS